jgi:ketosteroid isomerase-like protein
MAKTRSPREVFLALVNGIADGNPDGLPELYAEQIDVTHPFDPLHGAPYRSREDIRKGMERLRAAGPRPRRRVGNVTIHETIDPEVIVAEFEYQGTTGAGEPYALPAVFVMRVRDGEIVSSRDYHDHLASARVAGRLGELFAAISAQDAGPGAGTNKP